MAFLVKDWKNAPDATTPLSAAALEDLEARLSAYSTLLAAATNANDRGVVADGTTDDTAAWTALIASLADGEAVTWTGNSRVQPGLTFQGRVALLGQGALRSAFTIAGGSSTNDGIILGGSDGVRYGHVARDFCILGAASCCRRALVLLNLVDPQVNVWIKAGATGHGASIEGVQNAKHVQITVSNNTSLAYAGTAPAHGIRVVGSSLIPTNANRFAFVTEGLTGDGILGDATVGVAGSNNNYLSGVSQGNGGKGVSLKQWTDFVVRDFHSEGATGTDLYLDGCQRGGIGDGVFVDTDTSLVSCTDMTLDGLTTVNLAIDAATTGTRRRRVTINGGTDTDSSAGSGRTTSDASLRGQTGSAALSIADGGIYTYSMTVTGARPGDFALASLSVVVPAGVVMGQATVSANDVVTVAFYNRSGSTWNATVVVYAMVFKR